MWFPGFPNQTTPRAMICWEMCLLTRSVLWVSLVMSTQLTYFIIRFLRTWWIMHLNEHSHSYCLFIIVFLKSYMECGFKSSKIILVIRRLQLSWHLYILITDVVTHLLNRSVHECSWSMPVPWDRTSCWLDHLDQAKLPWLTTSWTLKVQCNVMDVATTTADKIYRLFIHVGPPIVLR